MAKRIFLPAALLLLFVSGAAAATPDLAARISALRAEMNAIVDNAGEEADFTDHGADFDAAFRRQFPDGIAPELQEASADAQLKTLFYTYLDFLIFRDTGFDDTELETVFRAMEEKGLTDPKTVSLAYRFYLTFRRFDEASEFRRNHPDYELPEAPTLVPEKLAADARPVLALSEDGGELRRESVKFGSSSMVVIAGHPLCHFTQNAIADISADPALADRLLADAILISEPFASLTDGAIPEWNRTHPEIQFRYAENKRDWPEINYWGTPTFYFFKEGRLMRKVVGWPRDAGDERRAALWEGLRAIDSE